jgi:hypothetical protein
MLKLTVAVLTIALAGTASAAGWRSLRVDGRSEAAFTESVEAFKEKLPLSRRYAFAWALQDIWVEGVKDAEANQRDYTDDDFFREVDGLRYEEVVTLLDPTGDTEATRRKEAYARVSAATSANRFAAFRPSPWANTPRRPPGGWGTSMNSIAQAQQCKCMSSNGPQGN